MKILLVEDHRLVADAFTAMLRETSEHNHTTACYSTQQALSLLDAGHTFDLILTDLLMPGIDGIGLLTALRNRGSDTPVIMISASDEERHVRASIEHGASGFISKTLPGAEMLACIRNVLAGQRCFPDRYLSRVVAGQPSADDERTGQPGVRQMQVLQLMADGHSNKQISQIVGIKEATVKYHTSQLFKLFGVRNRTSCVRQAQARGLVTRFDD